MAKLWNVGIAGVLGLALVGCAGEVDPTAESTESVEQAGPNEEQAAAEPEACDNYGDVRECTAANGTQGAQLCDYGAASDFQLFWSGCAEATACMPGDSISCGLDESLFGDLRMHCRLLEDGKYGYEGLDCSTPLVLSFDDRPVEFTQAGGAFDLVGGGMSLSHDWVSAATPWLALDKDGNGSIDDGSELFGSMTRLANGARAEHGFMALQGLDENGDGVIDAKDTGFDRLLLWRDHDQNRQSSANELSRVADSGIQSLSLEYTRQPRCTATACEVERASFEFTAADGSVKRGTTIDVHFLLY